MRFSGVNLGPSRHYSRTVPYLSSHSPHQPLQYKKTGPKPCPFAPCHAPALWPSAEYICTALGEFRGGRPPLTGVSGGVPLILCVFPRADGWEEERPCYGHHTDASWGHPTVNQPDRPPPESQPPQFLQTIKARPFPDCGTERRPAPPFAVDAGHDIVSRPISRVLYPSREGRWPSLWDGGYPPPLATNPRTGPGSPSSSYSVLLRVGFAQPAGHPTAGELLPHHFTLTPNPLTIQGEANPFARPGAVCFCGTVRRVAPPGSYPAPSPGGARTFLPSEPLARGQTAQRSGHPVC